MPYNARLDELDAFLYGQPYIQAREELRQPDGSFNCTNAVWLMFQRQGLYSDFFEETEARLLELGSTQAVLDEYMAEDRGADGT